MVIEWPDPSEWNFARIFVKMFEVCQTIRRLFCDGRVAQLGERIHGMDEVAGSIPVTSTKFSPIVKEDRKVGQTVLTPINEKPGTWSFRGALRAEESAFGLVGRGILRFAQHDNRNGSWLRPRLLAQSLDFCPEIQSIGRFREYAAIDGLPAVYSRTLAAKSESVSSCTL